MIDITVKKTSIPIETMDMHELTRDLNIKNGNKIVMLVADGLGGLVQRTHTDCGTDEHGSEG